jgi:hypothetical protein
MTLTVPYNILLHLRVDEGDPPAKLESGELVPNWHPYFRFRENVRMSVEDNEALLSAVAARGCGIDVKKSEPVKLTNGERGLLIEAGGSFAICGPNNTARENEFFYLAPDIEPEMEPLMALATLLVQGARFARCSADLRRSRRSKKDPRERVAEFEKAQKLSTFDVQVVEATS